MLIGLVKEIKNKECRVGLTPDGTKKLIEHLQLASIVFPQVIKSYAQKF